MKTEAIKIVKSAGDMLKLQNSLDRRIARLRLFFMGSVVALSIVCVIALLIYFKHPCLFA
jgi:hypothetical protein